jgi:putative transcription factor
VFGSFLSLALLFNIENMSGVLITFYILIIFINSIKLTLFMAQCEMCTATVLHPISVKIEGVQMKVCDKCRKYGVEVKQVSAPSFRPNSNSSAVFRKAASRTPRPQETTEEIIPPNIGAKIKAARESRNMRQIDLSRMLSISESEIHQIEAGSLTPTIAVARKFEKGLGVTLVKRVELDTLEHAQMDSGLSKAPASAMTIGDLLQNALTKKKSK